MKRPIIPSFGLAVLASVSLVMPAFAVVNIVYVPVGNAGNAADTTGYGSVAYDYQIGKYEVTNSQYAGFLNAKGGSNDHAIYNSSMASYGITQNGSAGTYTYSVTSGLENRPVVYVSWFDAARFTNWLGNGQGSGDTETGAYTLISGQTSGIVTVNPGAQVYIPSENEWYKAAYYNGGTSAYSLYPNGQNTITTADANYNSSGSSDVGSYSGDPGSYGTFDQGGNVWEWNDAVISGSSRGMRGGAWWSLDNALSSALRDQNIPSTEYYVIGFRVASVPEPTSIILTMVAGGMMLIRRRR